MLSNLFKWARPPSSAEENSRGDVTQECKCRAIPLIKNELARGYMTRKEASRQDEVKKDLVLEKAAKDNVYWCLSPIIQT